MKTIMKEGHTALQLSDMELVTKEPLQLEPSQQQPHEWARGGAHRG